MLSLRSKTIIAILLIILTLTLTYGSFFIRHGVDFADILRSHHNDFVLLALITLMVLALAALILYRAFSKLYGKMIVLNQELNQKNEELQEAARRLEEK